MADRMKSMASHQSNASGEKNRTGNGSSVTPSDASGSSFRLASCLNATNAAATLLIFVGLLRAFGYMSDSKSIDALGYATVASPQPVVFINSADRRCSFSAVTESGKVVSQSYGPGLMQRIRGPMWRRFIYFKALTSIPSEPHEVKKVHAILKYGICTDRSLAEDLGIHEPIRRFRSVRWHARDPSATTATAEVQCEE